ncbi:MAG: MOSC domain-containing protein [Actinobacteria bacterium]|nr:MOSC domain-containing protein [Actinomycetota bacterium]
MPNDGRVVALYVAEAAGQPMRAREQVRAVPGRGVEGDRYFNASGVFSSETAPGREMTELTLIEIEVIEDLNLHGVALRPSETRRNMVTEGVPLNELVGRTFRTGDVSLLGVSLCEPCAYLVKSRSDRGVLRGLVHKGGLRAKILSEGTIGLGDRVAEATPEQMMPRTRDCSVTAR